MSCHAVLGLAIKYTIGWRVSEDEEVEGIDFAQHGETAYDLGRDLGSFAAGAPASVLANSTVSEGASA